MRTDHFTPGGETVYSLAFYNCAGGLAPLRPCLLFEAHAQEFHLHAFDFPGLRSRDCQKEAVGRIEGAVGIIAGEYFLVRPTIAYVSQLAHETPLSLTKSVAIDLVPGLPHNSQKRRDVHVGEVLIPVPDRLFEDLL